MSKNSKIPETIAITNFIFEAFRLHGQLIAFGDQMVKDFGLTSARWQVLGSIALSATDITVPMVARNIGLSRQAIQRVANDLAQEGFIIFEDNPHHKRAKLLVLTNKGNQIYQKADRRYSEWADNARSAFTADQLIDSQKMMRTMTDLCRNHQKTIQKEN